MHANADVLKSRAESVKTQVSTNLFHTIALVFYWSIMYMMRAIEYVIQVNTLPPWCHTRSRADLFVAEITNGHGPPQDSERQGPGESGQPKGRRQDRLMGVVLAVKSRLVNRFGAHTAAACDSCHQ